MRRLKMYTADFGEPETRCPICSGSTEEIARRRGRVEYRCLVCSLEFDVLGSVVPSASKRKGAETRQSRPLMNRKTPETGPVVEDPTR